MPTLPSVLNPVVGTDRYLAANTRAIEITGCTAGSAVMNGYYESNEATPPVYKKVGDEADKQIEHDGTKWELRDAVSTTPVEHWLSPTMPDTDAPISASYHLGVAVVWTVGAGGAGTAPTSIHRQLNPGRAEDVSNGISGGLLTP